MSPQNILILAETKQDSVADPTFELLAAARRLAAGTGGQVIAVVLSADALATPVLCRRPIVSS